MKHQSRLLLLALSISSATAAPISSVVSSAVASATAAGSLQPLTPTLTSSAAQATSTGGGFTNSSSPASNITVTPINPDEEPVGLTNQTAWALIYTYPLTVFANWASNVFSTGYSVNQIVHQRQLASPSSPGVVKPNVDTLYSRVVLDLSQNDVVLTVPNISDSRRYWVYPVLDVFGNVIAEIGAVNGNRAGNYLIRRAQDAQITPGYVDSNGTTVSTNVTASDTVSTNSTEAAQYAGVVSIPGSYGTMLIRLLLLANTTAELDAVHAIQDASRLADLERQPTSNDIETPSLQSFLPTAGNVSGISTPAAQLQFASLILPHSPPTLSSETSRVQTLLGAASIINGNYTTPANVDLTEASAIANASITAYVQSPSHIRDQGNSWQLSLVEDQGNFGSHYASAAYVALRGYQQQTVKQTLYPGYAALGFTSNFTLAQNESILLTFSGKPKVASPGFWSLSVYGDDGYLIPNELGRYSVGDRTPSLVYANGQPVYGNTTIAGANSTATNTTSTNTTSTAVSDTDGPFQVLVQPATIPPPANWTGNWIPANQTFSWILRWYVPEPALTNGSYVYPLVERIPSVVDANSTIIGTNATSATSAVFATATSSFASIVSTAA